MLSAHPELYHTFLECGEECLAQLLDNAVDARDLPGMADVDASLLYFCRLVKEHNKVALSCTVIALGQPLRYLLSYPCGRHRPVCSRQGPVLSFVPPYIEQRPGAAQLLDQTDQGYRQLDRVCLYTAQKKQHNLRLR